MAEKVNVLGMDGKVKETIDLPEVFNIIPRFDLIQRAVISSEAAEKQPQGRDPLAGKRNVAESWGNGFAAAHVPRNKGSGYPTARSAAFVPRTVRGRLAHPPRANKVITKKINKKERRLALLSAISATRKRDIVLLRGHVIEENQSLPLVIDDKIQSLKKTSQVIETLEKIGLTKELDRIRLGRTVRTSKEKRRGRKYRQPKGPLIVVKDDFGICAAVRNIAGVDIVNIESLNCSLLAPGTHGGRLTIWAQSAFNMLIKK